MEVQEHTDVTLAFDLSENTRQPANIEGIVLGRIAGLGEGGWPLVTYAQHPDDAGIIAATTQAVTHQDKGRPVALQFLDGDPAQPVIMGFLWTPGDPAIQKALQVSSDGERVELSADREIVLRCGKSSLTMTRAGKIIIRGKYLLSRSSGVNKIKGGSVQIN